MKKNFLAVALALTLVGSLAACSNRDPKTNGGTGSQNGTVSGSTAGSGSGTAGTVSRRYRGETNYDGRSYFDDGHYTAGSNGQVYNGGGDMVSRDLTQDARDIVRDAGDAIGDIGRGIGGVITGSGNGINSSGTPSWEPDSSAVRY